MPHRMNTFWKIVAAGAAAVLLFDTVASFASLRLGFPYGYASAGSVLIYGAVGYLAFRRRGFGAAIGAGLLVGLVDASLGWYISWLIGPGALPNSLATPFNIGASIVLVTLFAALCAGAGAAIARIARGPRSTG
jgi:hypothetical protein